jgi:hypothetical protein
MWHADESSQVVLTDDEPLMLFDLMHRWEDARA